MVNPKLLAYVKREISYGIPRDKLRDILIQNKWPQEEVDSALEEAVAEKPEQVLKEITKEPIDKEPQTEKPLTSVENKQFKFPFMYLIIALVVLFLAGSSFYFFFYKEKGPSIKVDDQVMLLAKSTCKEHCETGKCELFKDPKFSGSLDKKSCADLGVRCDKCD